MKYCVTDCMNDEVFFSTRATTACGMAEAAFRALHQDINQWFYYAPDEVINNLMDCGLPATVLLVYMQCVSRG